MQPGELVALMGLSGSGKTTVLRAVAGLEPFSGGRITVDGYALDPRATPHPELHHKVGMVFQFHCLWDHLTAGENVWLAPVHVYGALPSEAQARARELLDDLGVGHRETALPAELSGGEAQRVAIARALAADPKLLLMDEPTASLDPARRGELGDTLRRLAATGRSLLLTCHDDDFVRDFATGCWCWPTARWWSRAIPRGADVAHARGHAAPARPACRARQPRGERVRG